MPSRRRPPLGKPVALRAALLAAAVPGAAARGQDPVALRGPHYEVVCHFDGEAAARQALDVVEATWPVAMGLYGAPAERPEAPLVVHLYRDAAGYVAAEARLTAGRFRRNLAFAHFDSKSAHVALQPRLGDDVLARVGLTYQTLRLLVHEAAHLARFQAMPNFRSHPDWFADGNATWIETEVLKARGLLESVEEDPSFSTKIVHAQRLLARGELPAAARILEDDTAALSFWEKYAVRWLLFRFLLSEPELEQALRGTIAAMRRFGGGADFAARSAAALRRALGDDAFATLDERFRAHVAALRPRWHETSRSLETAGADWTHTAFADVDAAAFCTDAVGPEGCRVSGELTVLPGGGEQLRVLLQQGSNGFVSVDFTAGGGVAVTRRASDGSAPVTVGSASVPELVTGRAVAFGVSWRPGGELRVDVDGQQVLAVEVDPPRDGAWGLGAAAGSAGVWRGVTRQ